MKNSMTEVLKTIQKKYRTRQLRYDDQSYQFVQSMCAHFELVNWITPRAIEQLERIAERIDQIPQTIYGADPMRDLYKTGY